MASPSPDLDAAIEALPAFDHHAHLLAAPGAYALVDVLSESAEPAQRAQLVDHPAYQLAQRELEQRQVEDLLADCRFERMLVDDGFGFAGAMGLAEHEAVVGCPVGRVVRIETVAEQAAGGRPPFAETCARFHEALTAAFDQGAVALKTIAAYRYGLDLPASDRVDAARAYAAWTPGRLEDPHLIAWFLDQALEATRERAVPLQIHTGFGDADLALHRANPSLLKPLIERHTGRPLLLLHSYPYVAEAGWLASVYPHVFFDLSLAIPLIGHRAAALIMQALDLAPTTKLLFATDASRVPEMFWLATRWWRAGLGLALGSFVDAGVIDITTAVRWATRILAGNAREIYG